MIQNTNLNSLQALVETEQRESSKSSNELDVGLQLGGTDQVTEDHLDDKKGEERKEEEEEEKKKIPKTEKSRWTRT